MSLPTITGTGFLISDGVELKYSAAGNGWARLPLVFKNRRKDDSGNWTHDKEILIEGVVFGALAEFLADNMTERGDMAISGELYTEEYEGKTKVRMNIKTAAPMGPAKAKVPAYSAPAPAEDEPPF